MPNAYLDAAAVLSECGTYRYALTRRWAAGARTLVVIGLNPSTADATQDDPTIRRCVGFARREGCDALVMLNLFAVRATDPRVMLAHAEPVGPENDRHLLLTALPICGRTEVIPVAAWGVYGAHRGRAAMVAAMVPNLVCLGHTKDGHPRHPLYVRGDAPLMPYVRLRAALAATEPTP